VSDRVTERRAKAWSGRFSGTTSPLVEAFTSSIAVDQRLYADDIAGSRAHARMLREVGVLTAAEHRALDAGLRSVGRELDRGEFVFDDADEDIHMAVERRLHDIAGDVAGKLHTARSRNDQVVTDLRLFGRRACAELRGGVADLIEALVRRAAEHRTTVMPGYTHLQRAQVVSLAHHLLAYVEMLRRDAERLEQAQKSCDVLPLGSGALAGTTLPIDRTVVANLLGFAEVSANSIDAVADRDFAVDIITACAMLMVHLSRLSEDIVLWTSSEFGFATRPDSHATGSSLMPQKKNPDVLELVRGRTGAVIGSLVALLTTLKGLPLAYNRDLQEDKQPLFAAVDTAGACVAMLADLVGVIHFDTDAMRKAASDPALMATDVAEYMVARGVPFREAHHIAGRAVREALRRRTSLAELSAADWVAIDARLGADVVALFDVDAALRRRDLPGGPGPRSITRQLARANALVARIRRSAAR
jgi:argininosuccinate lyase